MTNLTSSRTTADTVVAILALIQTLFGVLRSLAWFQTGSDLMGQGLLILPLVGMVAYLRGALVAGIALLYVIFALGIFMRRDWARAFGIVASVINLLLVVSVLVQGEAILRALLWSIVPAIILWQIFARHKPALRV
jgi:hypothetical protein